MTTVHSANFVSEEAEIQNQNGPEEDEEVTKLARCVRSADGAREKRLCLSTFQSNNVPGILLDMIEQLIYDIEKLELGDKIDELLSKVDMLQFELNNIGDGLDSRFSRLHDHLEANGASFHDHLDLASTQIHDHIFSVYANLEDPDDLAAQNIEVPVLSC
eukprot:CAMPEP_0174273594 /NCGR_PEP_ID=MMETSP0439-20130205/55085_1 /TAXON_ID=0 /ORGANISM="Stereomyxa ramosa, Strain Chinc5" /LENGTH=159 /DNA_ID=CAMNT_0015364859 /DNA_START=87 /DNA_END=566 /DNA_ORIENTATION=+